MFFLSVGVISKAQKNVQKKEVGRMAEKEYIEREALKRKLIDEKSFFPAIVASALKEMPAADVVEVVHGEWIDRDEKTWCSVCDASNKQYKPPFCPHCGAKMNGARKEQS
jgi:hypothetical protein